MLTSYTLYIIAFLLYFLYCIITYKFLRKSQIDIIYKDAVTKFGLNWSNNDKNVMDVADSLSKWPIGNLFLNEGLFKFAFSGGLLLLITSVYLFGFLSAFIIIVWVFITQTFIGLLFKGKGIQFSAFLLLLISLILSLYKVVI